MGKDKAGKKMKRDDYEDELEKLHPGLKTSYGAVLAALITDEEASPRPDAQALTVLRAMLSGVKRKAKVPRTLH